MKVIPAVCLFVCLLSAVAPTSSAQETAKPPEKQNGLIRPFFTTEATAARQKIGSEKLLAAADLAAFYKDRLFLPAWSGPTADALIAAIAASAEEGLTPAHYHLARLLELRAAAARAPEDSVLAELDLLLSDAFLVLASHYSYGSIDPAAMAADWPPSPKRKELATTLKQALAAGKIRESLHSLLPDSPGYASLRKLHAQYKTLAGSTAWPVVPGGLKLQKGDTNSRVQALRHRLMAAGELATESQESPQFDANLEQAVKAFQRRHGLHDDGVVGPATLAALNTPLTTRLSQISANLERWRWLPHKTEPRYLLVNIPGFELTAIENEQPVLEMAVIVGKTSRQTPELSSNVSSVVVNPYWEIPRNIIRQDMIPRLRKEPDYLHRMGIRILRGWGPGTQELDPAQFNWKKITPGNFHFRMRQDPGPVNALGRLKFMFPNTHDVYLHDTPAKELFRKDIRAFSSGCIRVAKPLELAGYLLQKTSLQSSAALEAALATEKSTYHTLATRIPLHVVYRTAWVDGAGTLQFRQDIYGRDALLASALAHAPGGGIHD